MLSFTKIRLAHLLLATAWLVVAGCHATYDQRFKFRPQPAQTNARLSHSHVVRTLASIIGVRNADKKEHIPLSLEAVLLIENDGRTPVYFNPQSLRLLSGSLEPFGEPTTDPSQAVEIPPHESLRVRARFPLPPQMKLKSVDLDGLNLRWRLKTSRDQTLTQSASFTRRLPAEYDPDFRPAFGVHAGYGVGF